MGLRTMVSCVYSRADYCPAESLETRAFPPPIHSKGLQDGLTALVCLVRFPHLTSTSASLIASSLSTSYVPQGRNPHAAC
jgi:hypothetical protein